MIIETFINGAWVQQDPTIEGQLYRRKYPAGTKRNPDNGLMETVYAITELYYVPPKPHTRISRLKFKQRLTQAERIAIRTEAETNPIVYDFYDLLDSASYIELDGSTDDGTEVRDGVNYLESIGVIDAGRATVILDTPVSDQEAFKD